MARRTTRNTIVVRSPNGLGVPRLEAVGSAVLIPGWTVEIKAAGDKLGTLAAKGQAFGKFIVLENHTPDTITHPTKDAVDIPYAADDTVYYCQAPPGALMNLWLADGETVVKGKTFVAGGTGGKVFACGTGLNVGTSNPIGVAWEDKDNSSGGTAVRLLVQIQ
jgi:hypothetical protein